MARNSLFGSHRLSTVGDVRRALNPLQEQADRVGRQVEQFAETLDHFDPLRDGSGQGTATALPLVQQFRKIADDTVQQLKRRHGEERKQLFKQARRRLNSGSTALILHPEDQSSGLEIGTTVQDLRHWEREQQTWDLLSIALQIQHSTNAQVEPKDYVPLKRPATTPVHRYSSESAVYNAFLASNDGAWEKHVIAQWLSRVADSGGEDVYEVVEDLIDIQGESDALTAHGWLRAKETIKQQKRLRSWNKPLDPDAKEVDVAFSGHNQAGSLVTQLDPDAPTRQERQLPSEDLAFERAIWIGCWELIKRGRPWSEVLDWCKERTETWRALSMCPDLSMDPENGTEGGDIRGRAFWQQTCLRLATNGGVDDYERAVYGLSGGDASSAFKVCKTWDEFLFSWLSCQVIQGFNAFLCEKFRMPQVVPSNDISGSSRASIQRFVETLRAKDETRAQMLSPFTMLQSSIMTGQVSQFIIEQGSQLSKHLQEAKYGLIGNEYGIDTQPTSTRPTSTLTPDDHDFLRILTHLIPIVAAIDPKLAKNPAAENIIVAYIDYLGKAGKQQLLPLYASRLSDDRAPICMARQLIYIKDTTERQTIVRLMQGLEMAYDVILMAQVDVIIADTKLADSFPPLEILTRERLSSQDIPGLKKGFMTNVVQEWQTDLIDALEWYLILDGHWNETFEAGSMVYKHFLKTRSWEAASELARRINFSRISRMKTKKILGREVDLSDVLEHGDPFLDQDAMDEDSETASTKNLKAEAQRDELLKSSRTFQDLENFVRALNSINSWKKVFNAGQEAFKQAAEGDKGGLKDLRRDLAAAHTAVSAAIEPLTRGWLMSPKDDQEATETSQIRKQMLPEIILAYLSIQSVSGRYLHRDELLQCMNLARTIANPDGSDLCDVFVEAGRMAELSTFMASLSQQILAAYEATGSKPLTKKAKGDGELLDIWSIGAEV